MDDSIILDPITLQRLADLARAVAQPREDVLGRLVHSFATDSAARLLLLEDAMREADDDKGVRAAHSIKGAAGNMGALRVVAAANVVEASCRAGLSAATATQVRVEILTLGQELKDAIAELRRTFGLKE